MHVHVHVHRSTGFLMEGFPSTSDELHYMVSKGLYPDAAILMQVKLSIMTYMYMYRYTMYIVCNHIYNSPS